MTTDSSNQKMQIFELNVFVILRQSNGHFVLFYEKLIIITIYRLQFDEILFYELSEIQSHSS